MIVKYGLIFTITIYTISNFRYLTNSVEKSAAASLGSSQQEAVASLKNCACADHASHACKTRLKASTVILSAACTNIRSTEIDTFEKNSTLSKAVVLTILKYKFK